MATSPPPRPRTETEAELGFTPKDAVRWLSPRELLATGMRVLLSGIFGAYSDKRELQAALQRCEPFDYTGEPEVWIDYVSDLGDGFAPTYHVARQLADAKLDLTGPDGQAIPTRAGKILLMGGDQVYPAATKEDYENRLVGPYRAALPWSDGQRHLYAIPGNHDWYDGLTSFIRVFCQSDWVGGWKTRQPRSYFALQLPHRWWLFGIDIQFDNYIDEPQLRYFDETVGSQVQPGDSIILCSAKPSWVKSNLDHPEAFVNLDYFVRKVVTVRQADVRLYLTGDTHHYAHYEEVGGQGRHLITAGGGGAYLSNTHHLPVELELPPPGSRDPGKSAPSSRYRLATSFPSRERSRKMRKGILDLPFENVGFWGLSAGLFAIFGWIVASSLRNAGVSVAGRLKDLTSWDVVQALLHSTLGVGAMLVLVWALATFTQKDSALKRWSLGGVHAFLQFVAIVAAIRVATWALSDVDGPLFWVLFFGLLGAGGGLLGSMVTAVYLYVADHFACNSNELFAAQRIPDYKCFVRLHLDDAGTLTAYPVGIEKTARKWKLRPDGEPHEPWYEPDGPHTPPRLIEPPIRVSPAVRP